eukprot:TRINITY_DN19054_c0_g1_i2.p1 TRINITY_DN19054_c0_g1~~TRINITY_DN19054_c0_g1_i2.p1  ORF type:complete len:981 (+),score=155.62 TRINITY_DN19054_c0_g1_i2:212-3154(+)
MSPVCRLSTAPVPQTTVPPLVIDSLQRHSSHPRPKDKKDFSTALQLSSLSPPKRTSSNPINVHPTLLVNLSNPSMTSPRPGKKTTFLDYEPNDSSNSNKILEHAVQAVLDRDAQCFSEDGDSSQISNLYNESTSSETSFGATNSSFARTILNDIRKGDVHINAAESIKVRVGATKDVQADNTPNLNESYGSLKQTVSLNQQHYIPSSALWRGGGVMGTLRSFLCCCNRSKNDVYKQISRNPNGNNHTTVPMTPVVVKLIVKVKEVFSCLLQPNMETYQMKGLALRVQAAIGSLYDMPSWHRFDVLTRSIPAWCTPMLAVLEELREKYLTKEPVVSAAAHHSIRLIELFLMCDKESHGRLSFSNIKQMTLPLNLSMTTSEIRALFNETADGDGMLGFGQFTIFYERLFDDSAVRPIFDVISNGQPNISTSQLHRFSTRQGEYVTTSQIELLVQDWGSGLSPTSLSLAEFSRYISSPANSWFDHRKGVVYHDMTKPITNYFVSSSHNTYLSGDQLTSESSSLMYKYALLRGCRCLEVDIWDGREEPVVTHGHTKTTKIPFEEVIATINEYAFVVSPYPVILSLEVHASLPQQVVMARVMKRIFGDKLHVPIAYSGIQLNDPSFTPESLKHRILIKAAMANPNTTNGTGARRNSFVQLSPTLPTGEEASLPSFAAFGSPIESDNECDDGPVVGIQKIVAPSLSSCVYFMANKLRNGLPSEHIATAKPYECISLQERRAEELMGASYAELNKLCCTRIYPKATRVDSSNFDPQVFWGGGSQFVALNLQTPDYSTRLNQAKFEDNGSCGYVLKPPWLRDIAKTFSDTGTTTIQIKVIKGGNFPRSKRTIDPYVEAMISSVPGDDTSKNPVRTVTVYSNGFNPTWNEILTLQTKVPEIAILTLRVVNKRDDTFVAETSVPIPCLRAGIRSCPLRDAHSRTIRGSYLLCDIKVSREDVPQQPLPKGERRKTWARKSSAGGASIYGFE